MDLRVEFLLKTDSGYPKDTGVTLLILSFWFRVARMSCNVFAAFQSFFSLYLGELPHNLPRASFLSVCLGLRSGRQLAS